MYLMQEACRVMDRVLVRVQVVLVQEGLVLEQCHHRHCH
jgi:hypothetical protein